MPYRVTVNAMELEQGSLQDVRAAVAGLVTSRLGQDPERLASDAQMVNQAFNTGAVEETVALRGQWFTVFDAFGEDPARILVTEEEG